ncbi:SPOR domain-containing protein [candidate division KSB1 bacterium]
MNRKRVFISFIVISIISCILVSCSQTKKLTSTIADDPAEENKQDILITEGNIDIPLEVGEKEFYKIQLMATQDFNKAQSLKRTIQDYTDKSIFLINEKDLWKVQVGDFQSREKALAERDVFRQLGWIDTWLIQYRISQPNTEIIPVEMAAEKLTEYYTVQVIATKNKLTAENMLNSLKVLNVNDAVLIEDGEYWKIQVGRFKDNREAAAKLDQMKRMGFNDSWVTKRTIKKPHN